MHSSSFHLFLEVVVLSACLQGYGVHAMSSANIPGLVVGHCLISGGVVLPREEVGVGYVSEVSEVGVLDTFQKRF